MQPTPTSAPIAAVLDIAYGVDRAGMTPEIWAQLTKAVSPAGAGK